MTDQDPTRMAALEAELASLRTEMQDFSYTVSHDLRANLRHILSYAQLVREDAGHLLPQETLGFLDTISDSARHMGVQMDGLMELTRLGTATLQMEPLPLLPLVQDVVGELQLQYPQRQIEWRLAAEMPAVQADTSLLRLALHAVLDNAVKFTAHRPIAQISILPVLATPPMRDFRQTRQCGSRCRTMAPGSTRPWAPSCFTPLRACTPASSFPALAWVWH